ncbi:hypothetical protein [Cytobacillus sp. IB215316]|uniref:hypothetical protein n=1 Tax=Cytobacillus sp. IB215316 TaxID=3097354 RepID=UPI002A17056A|nr:hypothetical protein [Cytobacillus sp. IB215316]MDX8360714.1 hypothetical protein [Cytobacillus sp. IB215316]
MENKNNEEDGAKSDKETKKERDTVSIEWGKFFKDLDHTLESNGWKGRKPQRDDE